jgi:putative ABC transport system permease protein
VDIPDEEGYQTGQRTVSPFWQVSGEWPQEPTGDVPQTLVGHAGAQQRLEGGRYAHAECRNHTQTVVVSGILSSGGEEDNQLVMPLNVVQQLLNLQGKVQAIRVSALTVPENELSRRARENLDALNAEEYDLWYCTAYVSSIAHQLEEAISGAEVRPVWQVAPRKGGDRQNPAADGVVTLAALAAAAMGIASLMTSTIMERAKEIGLMKALGARQWQILLLFYLEAASSGLAGGAVGCIAGWGWRRPSG